MTNDGDDARATREHCIFNVLIDYTGKTLAANVINEVRDKIVREIEDGPCSWAFKPGAENKKTRVSPL